MKKLVSICIPTYNQELFIEETIESCLKQSYRPLEIIVLDDQSTDMTFSLALSLANQANQARLAKSPSPKLDNNSDNILRVRVQQNSTRKGVGGNWNAVTNMANGEFIKLLCGDDLIDPNCIETQVALLLAYPDLSVISCQRRIINSNSETLYTPIVNQFTKPTEISTGLDINWRAGTNIIGEPLCVLFRKTDFCKTTGFDGSLPYMIDLSLWIQLWRQGKLLRTTSVLGSFRIHSKSLTSQLKLKHFYEYLEFMKKTATQIPFWTYIQATIFAFLKCIIRNVFIIWVFNKKQKRA